MIKKADSIECKEDTKMSSESLSQSNAQLIQASSASELPCGSNNNNNNTNNDDGEIVTGDASSIEIGRKLSTVEEIKASECELPNQQDSSIDTPQTPSLKKQSSSSLASLPASISTQTLPTQEYPDTTGSLNTVIDQSIDVDVEVTNQSNVTAAAVKCDMPRRSSTETDRKAKSIKKSRSRSIEEKEKKMSCCGRDEGNKVEDICQDNAQRSSFDEDKLPIQRHCCKQSSLAQQQSQASQDEDYEIAMVTGLLPGCVGEF